LIFDSDGLEDSDAPPAMAPPEALKAAARAGIIDVLLEHE
jgi:hypothetical protein